MKILMIYPNKVMITRAPLGLGYIESYLKEAGHEMRLFDTTFLKCTNTLDDDSLREKGLQIIKLDYKNLNIVEKHVDIFEKLKKECNDFKPDIIGMSVVDPNYQFGLIILKYCKRMWPSTPTIVGGALVTFVPEDIIKEKCIDAIGRGECEASIVDFCNKFEEGGWENTYNVSNFWIKDRKNDIIHKNDMVLFDSRSGLPPNLDIYDDRHFIRPLGGKMYRMATVIWTRGCLFNCFYCANTSFYKTAEVGVKEYYRIKNIKCLIEELKNIKEKYNLNFIMFVDDIWPMHKPKIIREFCDLYKKYVDLPFSVNLHCKMVKKESFDMAVDAGLRNVCIGVESGNKEIREKVLNRIYSDEDVQKVFDLAHKHKIRCSSFNIIGLPFETRENILETVQLNRKLKPHSATVTIFHPYRGSALREKCIEKGYIKHDNNKYEDVYRSESQLDMPQISKKEISGLMNSFQLYLKLPEKYYDLIQQQETLDTPEAKRIREELLPIFNKVKKQEPDWDFNKKDCWWK